MWHFRMRDSWCLALALVSLMVLLGGCSGEETGPGGGETTDNGRLTVSLGDRAKGLQVKAGQVNQFTFDYELPAGSGLYDAVAVDLAATLEKHVAVTVSGTSALKSSLGVLRQWLAGDAVTATATVRIAGARQAAQVCTVGTKFGPFTVSGTQASQPTSVDSKTVSASGASLSIINGGAFAVCMIIEAPVDATVDIDAVVVERSTASDDGRNCDKASADLDGRWVGTFNCSRSCDDGISIPTTYSGLSEVVITQNGRQAQGQVTFGDSGDSIDFPGRICGNVFAFNRDSAYEVESGDFVLKADGSAAMTTTSTLEGPPSCTEPCVYTLQRPL